MYNRGLGGKALDNNWVGESYYAYNGHGDTTNLTKQSSGTALAITATYDYDAFGNCTAGGGESDANPFRYNGQYTDFEGETGLIYLRNRYYDPTIGRFTQEDPAKDGLNWYVYCNNDPVNMVDPWGLKPGDRFKSLDDAAIDAGNYYLKITYDNDEEMVGYFYQDKDGNYYYEDTPNLAINKMLAFTVEWDTEPLAVIHTHVFYDVNNSNDGFSVPGATTGEVGSDTEFTDLTGITLYIASPVGNLRKYSEGNDVLIYDKLNVDPKYIEYQNMSNTLLWELLDKQYPNMNKMDIVKAKMKHPDSLYEMFKELGIIK